MRIPQALLVLVLITTLVGAQPRVIDFEDRGVGLVSAEYASRGVIFDRAYIDQHANAHSGTRVLRSIAPNEEVFSAAPLRMRFTGRMARVALFAGNLTGITGRGTLRAFDASNVLVGQDGPRPLPTNAFTASFQVRANSPRIVRAEFHVEGSPLVTVDDVTVEGTSDPLPTVPPQVAISTPTDGATLDEGAFSIAGTAAGPGLLEPVVLSVTGGRPPDSTAPPSQNELSLSGTGASRSFALIYNALVGPYTLTATARNSANLAGSATVRLSVVPAAIRTRFASSGGAGVFGALRFGAHDGDCVVAVYDNGLIAAPGNTTFVVTGAVFAKWMATRAPGGFLSRVGCPTTEERDALGGARAQDFRRGRIYARGNETAYVPAVFRDAIETLGGEATTGIALTDPSDSPGAMETWLFQRFARVDLPGVEPSTLEIRGSPAVLYVERVGDGLDGVGRTPDGNSPTVYRTFPCAGNLGPCTVTKPEYETTITSCNGRYPVTSPTEWQNISGFYTPVTGWVRGSKLACTDNPLTHDYQMTNNSDRCSATDVFPSDWNVSVRPLAGFGARTTSEQTYMEIEFEAFYARHFFAGWGWPVAGDLVATNGYWIMDCGHSPTRAEIHPPYLLSHSRMRKRPDGRLETLTAIWVNGFYSGGEMNLDIWPPPRPSPDAFLTLTKPVDADAAFDVNLQLTTSYAGARLRFTAPSREVRIEESGQMKWMTGRGYEGEWTVGWALR